MQAQAGLFPQGAMPGTMSSNFALGGQGGFGANMFPAQQWQTFTNQSPMMQGPTGVMMPMMPGAAFNPYAMAGGGAAMSPVANLYAPAIPPPPPAYAGAQGRVMSPFPALYGPPPAPPMFDTAFSAGRAQIEATDMRYDQSRLTGYGVSARIGGNLAAAGVGALAGGMTAGPVGAIMGAIGGFIGGELAGVGQASQNAFMNTIAAPAANMMGYGRGIHHMSRGFAMGGDYGDVIGAGMSHQASVHSARMLEDMGNSASFRRETGNMFNASDVMKVTQLGADQGLMSGVQSPDQLIRRSREVLKSAKAIMEFANEPDMQRIVEVMGQMQASGLNLHETVQAVSHGRAAARMAGMSFEQMAATGGAMGSQTYQSMGLSQGLGFQVGMGNLGQARLGQHQGVLGQGLLSLMGGAAGYAGLNNMYSASALQMPMMVPGLMSASGGLDANSIQRLVRGGVDHFDLTRRGSENLSAMTGRMGSSGLGMAVMMQPYLQDAVGRMQESQGVFSRRNIEDQTILNTMRSFGQRNDSGFSTMAQALGMGQSQALGRLQELTNPDYFRGQREQIDATRRERRATYLQGVEDRAPGWWENFSEDPENGGSGSAGRWGTRIGFRVRNAYETFAHGGPSAVGAYGSAAARRQQESFTASARGRDLMRRMAEDAGRAAPPELSTMGRINADTSIMENHGAGWLSAGLAARSGAYLGLGMSQGERNFEVSQIQETGRAYQSMLNATPRQRAEAAQHVTQDFGNQAGASAFALAVAQRANRSGSTDGTGFRHLADEAAGLVAFGGMSGNRGLSGADLRNDYIRAATQAGGLGEGRAMLNWNNQSDRLMQSISGDARLMFNSTGLQRINRAIQDGQTITGDNTSIASVLERRRNDAYEPLLGREVGTREITQFNRLADMQGEGVGDTEEKRRLSRQYGAMINGLQTQLGGRDRDRAAQRISELTQEMRRRGTFTSSELDQIHAGVGSHTAEIEGDEGLRQVGQRLLAHQATAGQLIDAGAALGDRREAFDGLMRRTRGAESLARDTDSPLGRLFEGTTARGKDFDTVLRENIARRAQDRDYMESLTEQQRDAVRRAAQGDDGAFADISGRASRRGQAEEDAGKRFKDSWWARLMSADQRIGDTREDYVRREGARGTQDDAHAAAQTDQVDDTESQARGLGVGGENSELRAAARDLRDAARMISTAAQSGQMENLLNTQ